MKFSSYFPYNAKLCINGHHWAQRQAEKAGIAFTAMDNAFADVDDNADNQGFRNQLLTIRGGRDGVGGRFASIHR
jgi:hypothetical protein